MIKTYKTCFVCYFMNMLFLHFFLISGLDSSSSENSIQPTINRFKTSSVIFFSRISLSIILFLYRMKIEMNSFFVDRFLLRDRFFSLFSKFQKHGFSSNIKNNVKTKFKLERERLNNNDFR